MRKYETKPEHMTRDEIRAFIKKYRGKRLPVVINWLDITGWISEDIKTKEPAYKETVGYIHDVRSMVGIKYLVIAYDTVPVWSKQEDWRGEKEWDFACIPLGCVWSVEKR